APRRRLRAALALLVGGAVPLAAALALQFAGTGQWAPLTTSSGINLSIGYHEGSTGTYELPWERRAAQFAARYTDLEEASVRRASLEAGRALTPRQASAHWTQQALT